MARPRKCRRVCNLPETNVFEPAGSRKGETVILNLDGMKRSGLLTGWDFPRNSALSRWECPAPPYS